MKFQIFIGYRPLLDAAKTFAVDAEITERVCCGKKDGCCMNESKETIETNSSGTSNSSISL